ncbi:major facilitator superfamily domain-containing protein 8-like isoform X2 [Rhopilema esculentum]
MLLSAMEYSITLPSLWPYLQQVDKKVSAQFLGIVAGGFSICQMIGSFLFGIWCLYRPAIEPFVAAAALRFLGNFLYVFAENCPGNGGKILILVSKLIVGLSTGDMAVCRAVLSQATTKDERKGAFAVMAGMQVLGYAVGPAFQSAAVPLVGKGLHYFGLNIDIFNIPGWIGIVVEIINILLIFIWFKEYNIDVHDNRENLPKPNTGAVLVTTMAYYVLFSVFAMLETMTAPLIADEFALSKDKVVFYAGIILSSLAVIVLATFWVIKFASNRIRERTVLLTGYVIMLVAFIIFLPWGSEHPPLQVKETIDVGNLTKTVLSEGCPIRYSWCKTTPKIYLSQYIIAMLIGFIGFALPSMVINSLYSKIIGPRKQGLYMALASCAGSFARFTGPLVMTSLYANFGPRWLFIFLASVNLSAAALIFGFFKMLVPFEEITNLSLYDEL